MFNKKILIVTIVMILMCFTGCVRVGFDKNIEKKDMETHNIDEEKVIDIGNKEKISISGVLCDINVITEDRDNIKAHLYGSVTAAISPKLEARDNVNEVKIVSKWPALNVGSIGPNDLNLDIYIPNTYDNYLELNVISGNINLKEMNKLISLSIETVSGDIEFSDINLEECNLKSISGDLDIKNLYSNETNIKTTSGNVRLKGFSGELISNTISGNISVEYIDFSNDIKMDSVSGRIIIDLPDDSEFTLKTHTVSGKMKCDFPIVLNGESDKHDINGEVGNGKYSIKLETTSGDIKID